MNREVNNVLFCYFFLCIHQLLILMQASLEVKIQKYARKCARFACVIMLRVRNPNV
jgi:hypothetical protein